MDPSTSLLAVFLFSFVVGFGAVVSPGPVSIAIISQAPRLGWLTGPLVATGHSFLELLIVILLAFGLSTGLAQPWIQVTIAILGGLLLTWMGGKMLWDTWHGRISLPDSQTNTHTMNSKQLIGLGMLATVSNPFWYAWWVTVAAGYLAQARTLGASGVFAFYIGHISADYAWDTTLSTVIGGGRQWITERTYRILIILAGIFMIYFGLVFLVQGGSSFY